MSSSTFDSLVASNQISGYTGDQPTVNTTKFKENINHAIQEKYDKTEGRSVDEDGAGSEKIRFTFMGKKTAIERTTERVIVPEGYSATGLAGHRNPTRHNLSNRWMAPRNMHDDSEIKVNQTIMQHMDLKSPTVQGIAMAFARARCLYFLEGVIGNVWVGESEADIASQALPDDQKIEHLDAGMTTAKARRAKLVLDYKDVPAEDRYMFFSAEQLDNMLDDPYIISGDYNNLGMLRDGTMPGNKWLGFQWVLVSKDCLPVTGSGVGRVRKAVAYWKDATVRGIWQDIQEASVDRIPTWFNNTLIQNDAYMNGSRSFDEGVVEIQCVESITPDLD